MTGQLPLNFLQGNTDACTINRIHIKRRLTMANAKEKELLAGIKPVGFMKDRKDKEFAPESFAFPACFASAIRKISGEERVQRIKSHQREWVFDLDYHEAMAASGMAFANLWPRNYVLDFSVNDFSKATPL